MKKILLFISFIMIAFFSISQRGFESRLSIGIPDAVSRDTVSFNTSVDLAYMFTGKKNKEVEDDYEYDSEDHVMTKAVGMASGGGIGFSVGYTAFKKNGEQSSYQFIPISFVPRLMYLDAVSLSLPIGYAMPYKGEDHEGGIYLAPSFDIWGKNLSVNFSYRVIGFFGDDEEVEGWFWKTFNFGIAYRFYSY